MSYANKGEIKRKAFDKTIIDAINDEDIKVFLRPFNRESDLMQTLIFNTMDKAVSKVLIKDIENMTPFAIPFIGRIKVSPGKIMELNNISIVADEFGYKSFDDMPKEIYDAACIRLIELTKEGLSELTKIRRAARIEGAIHPKAPVHKVSTGRMIRTLNLAKIKQQCKDRK